MIASLAFVLLIAAVLIQAVFLFRRNAATEPVSPYLIAASIVLLVGTIVERSIAIGFVALTGTFESLLFYSAAIAAVVMTYRLQTRIRYDRFVAFAAVFLAVVFLAIASSPLLPKDALPPIPALRSAWLVLHVSFAFIGEAFFVVAFSASIAFLVSRRDDRRSEFDRIAYTAVAIGYPFFTAGALIFGAVWAQQAWGRWWGWDPKETWALVTWLAYTAYLHVRLVLKRKDSIPSWVCVAGFLCTIFTFFGVNYLLPGLHSYG
jgi:ABC-type transport system involved in cytochrome c biogenesis permease subunit